MKPEKDIINSKRFQNILGWVTLVALIILLFLKFWLGHCELWLCGLFVGTVTAYFILSNSHTKDIEEEDE